MSGVHRGIASTSTEMKLSKRGRKSTRREIRMSVSLYRYDPEHCDGEPCIGDCDLCRNWNWEDFEEYEDGEEDDERN